MERTSIRKLISKDLYICVDGEQISMAEAHQRWGEGEFPSPVVGNCFSFFDYARLPLVISPGWIGLGILPVRSKMILFGLPKVGKSYLAQQAGYSIAESTDWLGFPTEPLVEEPVVLYIQAEIAETELQQRLYGLSSSNAYAETLHGLKLLGKDCKVLEERLEAVHPDVLILDPLYMFIDGDLNEIHDVTACNDIIDQVIEQYGCSIVVVHHSRKPSFEGTQGFVEALGSIGITAFYDSILWVEKKAEGLGALHFLLRNARSPEPVLIEQREGGLWARASLETPDIPTWTTAKQMAERLAKPLDNLVFRLDWMVREGKLEKDSFGRYKALG